MRQRYAWMLKLGIGCLCPKNRFEQANDISHSYNPAATTAIG
jgi:hypothetical protein